MIKKLTFLALLFSLFCVFSPVYAQTVPCNALSNPPCDPFENGWTVMVTGGYSAVSSAPTNNGTLGSIAFRVAQHWNIRQDNYVIASPAISIDTAGPEYRVSANHIFPSLSGNFPIVNNMEFFFNGKIGASYQPGTPNSHHIAYGGGAGIEVNLGNNFSVRPLDVSYIRTSLLTNGGSFLGNHLQFAAGIGVRF